MCSYPDTMATYRIKPSPNLTHLFIFGASNSTKFIFLCLSVGKFTMPPQVHVDVWIRILCGLCPVYLSLSERPKIWITIHVQNVNIFFFPGFRYLFTLLQFGIAFCFQPFSSFFLARSTQTELTWKQRYIQLTHTHTLLLRHTYRRNTHRRVAGLLSKIYGWVADFVEFSLSNSSEWCKMK